MQLSATSLLLAALSLLPTAFSAPASAHYGRFNHHQHHTRPAPSSSSSSSAPGPTPSSSPSPPPAPSSASSSWAPAPSSSSSAAWAPSSSAAWAPSSSAAWTPSSSASSASSSSASTSAPAPSTSAAPPATGGPAWVAYSDSWIGGENGPPDVSDVAGFNTFILSFLMVAGPADQAQEWASIGSAAQTTAKAAYTAAGVKLLVSAFGSTDAPTSAGADAADTANTMAQWVIDNQLDGIDVDYEDFDAINKGDGSAEQWLITFTQTLRNKLPAGQYIITHAPVAPWFSASLYPAGAYTKVNTEVGSLIDWYNIQFYNQGATEYTTCAGLLTQSSSAWPNTAVFQLAANGVPLNKIVIGKPATAADASNGYIDPATLSTCVSQAQAQGWAGGVMTWEYPNANSAWINTVRGSAWPV